MAVSVALLFQSGLASSQVSPAAPPRSNDVRAKRVLKTAGDLLQRIQRACEKTRGKLITSVTAPLRLGSALEVQSIEGEVYEYIVPVVDLDFRTRLVISVDPNGEKWRWFSQWGSREDFPPVSAKEAIEKAKTFLRKDGIKGECEDAEMVLAPDKTLYWMVKILANSNGGNPDRVYVPVISEGRILRASDSCQVAKWAEDSWSKDRSSPGSESPAKPSYGKTGLVDDDLTSILAGSNSGGESRKTKAAPLNYEIPDVPHYYQSTSYWCGPACLQMLFDYYGENVSQAEIAKVANSNSSYGVYNSDLVRAAHFSSKSTAIQDPSLKGYTSRKTGYGANYARWANGTSLYPSRYTDLKNLIANNFPVLILTDYNSGLNSGHFRLVKGYNDSVGYFTVHDPWYAGAYQGPNVHFNQSFLVDDLWLYSSRWGMIAAPWRVLVSKPESVSAGDVFTVKADVKYLGPAPMDGNYAVSSATASITASSSVYALVSGSPSVSLTKITTTGSEDQATWTLQSLKKTSTANIGVRATGTINGFSYSYPSYQDEIGGYGAKGGSSTTSGKSVWYLAEGSTNWGFSTYISIVNPNTQDVTVAVTYMTESGAVTGPKFKMPAKSQATVDPASTLGSVDFSTKVRCVEGKTIAVDRCMIWQANGATRSEAHSSIGVTSPSKVWYLPEGSSSWGFECWLLIQNPNSRKALCEVTYMIEGGSPKSFKREIPPNSRKTFSMLQDIGKKDASIKVSSDAGVIAERAMYRNSRICGHGSIGATSPAYNFFLAEGTTNYGFTTYILVQNPSSEPAEVNITYMTESGPTAHPANPILMPPLSRKTVRVNDFLPPVDFSTRVSSNKKIVAERAMYWSAGDGGGEACHDSIGLSAPARVFYLPDGDTTGDKETYTLVQNPNSSEIVVEVSYLTATGKGNVTLEEAIPAYSRRTFIMADIIPNGRAAIVVRSKTSGKKIMVERAMYWNSRGAGTDTIGGFSD